MALWLEGDNPTVGFGSNWHAHANDLSEFWDYVEAILADDLVLAVDLGGEHDGFEDVLDFRDDDATLERLTETYSAPKIRIKSFTGTKDGVLPCAT